MAGQTTHFHMSLREASDIFNPLSTNDNFETIDAKLYQLEQEGGIIGYTGTVSNKLLTLSGTPVANDTIFKFIPDDDCDTVTFSGAVRNIVGLDDNAVTLKANTLYVGWMTSSTMKTLAWPDSINATTLGGNAVEYYATAGGLETVKSTAETAVQTAQAAQTIANNALEASQKAGISLDLLWSPVSTQISGNIYAIPGDVATWVSSYKALVLINKTLNLSPIIIPISSDFYNTSFYATGPSSTLFGGNTSANYAQLTYIGGAYSLTISQTLSSSSGALGYVNPPYVFGLK